jgi:peroxiredoxin
LAEYNDVARSFAQRGVQVAFLSVDPPWRSARVRAELSLNFPLLCDVDKSVVTSWGLLNERERGGIARPAVFVIEPDLTVAFRSLDEVVQRVPPQTVLAFVDGETTGAPAVLRSTVRATARDYWRSLLGLLTRRPKNDR